MRGDAACPRPNSRRISVWGQGHVGIDERRIKAGGSGEGNRWIRLGPSIVGPIWIISSWAVVHVTLITCPCPIKG